MMATDPSHTATPATPTTPVTPATPTTPVTPAADTSWYDRLPTDLQEHAGVRVFKGKGADEVVKSYLNAQTLIGNSIRVPGEGAKPEEWNAIFQKLGMPAAADGYTITPPILPKGYEYNPESEAQVLKFAHEQRMTNSQAQALMNFMADQLTQEDVERREIIRTTDEQITKEWGSAKDRNVALASRAVLAADPSGELARVLEETGAENHPAVLKFFYDIGKQMVEDGAIAGDSTGVWGKEQIVAKMNEMRNSDPRFRLNTRHPDHIKAAEELLELQKQLDGG